MKIAMWNAHTFSVFIYGLVIWISHEFKVVIGQITLEASAPVNPIERNGILSLHCQVKDLTPGHRVEIYRNVGQEDEALSFGEAVTSSVDDRVFLAVRYMDASVVYFLSITDVTQDDSGVYTCKIIRTKGKIAEIAAQSVNMSVLYFPSEQYPQCDSSLKDGPLQIQEGDMLMLNCSSEKANPTVDIKWTRTGGGTIRGNQVTESGDIVYASVAFRVTKRDQHAVFLCNITSKALPGLSRTCHIGPLKVILNRNGDNVPSDTLPDANGNIDSNPPPTTITALAPVDSNVYTGGNRGVTRTKQNCIDYCSSYSSDVFYWIIATAVCVVLGLMFFIFGVGLLLKYKRVSNDIKRTNSGFTSARLAIDDIYAEVENKAAMKPYMSLDRARKFNNNQTMITHNVN